MDCDRRRSPELATAGAPRSRAPRRSRWPRARPGCPPPPSPPHVAWRKPAPTDLPVGGPGAPREGGGAENSSPSVLDPRAGVGHLGEPTFGPARLQLLEPFDVLLDAR